MILLEPDNGSGLIYDEVNEASKLITPLVFTYKEDGGKLHMYVGDYNDLHLIGILSSNK